LITALDLLVVVQKRQPRLDLGPDLAHSWDLYAGLRLDTQPEVRRLDLLQLFRNDGEAPGVPGQSRGRSLTVHLEMRTGRHADGQVQGSMPGCAYGQGGPRLRLTGVQVPDPSRDQHPFSTGDNITKTLLLVSELPAASGQMSRDLIRSPVKRALFCAGITVGGVGALELIAQRGELFRDCTFPGCFE
jgi:hypothetical protein